MRFDLGGVFILGLLVGSFLNSYLWRSRQQELPASPVSDDKTPAPSVWRGRSFCPQCRKPLAWYELLPLLSFVWQRGRCRGCKKPISWQYPLVELATGLLFVLSYAASFKQKILFPQSLFFIQQGIADYLLAVMVLLFVYDLRYGLVPDKVVLPAIVVAFIFTILRQHYNFAIPWFYALRLTLSALLLGLLFFAWQYFISRGRWLGSGDLRLGAFLGAALGWPSVTIGLLLAYLIGGLTGILLLSTRRKHFGETVPLGTFLMLGTAITFLYGERLWQWYLQL